MPKGIFEDGFSDDILAFQTFQDNELPSDNDILSDVAPLDESNLDQFVLECEFDLEIAALLLCEAPEDGHPLEAGLMNFDFEAMLDEISLEPEPANAQELLSQQQALVFGPLRPVVELCANHPYLQWLTADVHLPESVNRWLRSPHAIMAC